jgi:hypothetical protein
MAHDEDKARKDAEQDAQEDLELRDEDADQIAGGATSEGAGSSAPAPVLGGWDVKANPKV